MASKSNPQITIPRATYEELQQIAEIWGLPSPGLVVPMMVRQFGHLMKAGITVPESTAIYSDAVEPTAVYENLQQPSTAVYSNPVEPTAIYSDAVEPTASKSPADAFFEMEF